MWGRKLKSPIGRSSSSTTVVRPFAGGSFPGAGEGSQEDRIVRLEAAMTEAKEQQRELGEIYLKADGAFAKQMESLRNELLTEVQTALDEARKKLYSEIFARAKKGAAVVQKLRGDLEAVHEKVGLPSPAISNQESSPGPSAASPLAIGDCGAASACSSQEPTTHAPSSAGAPSIASRPSATPASSNAGFEGGLAGDLQRLRQDLSDVREAGRALAAAQAEAMDKGSRKAAEAHEALEQQLRAIRHELGDIREAGRTVGAAFAAHAGEVAAQAASRPQAEGDAGAGRGQNAGSKGAAAREAAKVKADLEEKCIKIWTRSSTSAHSSPTNAPRIDAEGQKVSPSGDGLREAARALAGPPDAGGLGKFSGEVWSAKGSAWEMFETFRGRQKEEGLRCKGATAEWQVRDVTAWLRALPRGHALESPLFGADVPGLGKLSGLRLLFFPNGGSQVNLAGSCSLQLVCPRDAPDAKYELSVGTQTSTTLNTKSGAANFTTLEPQFGDDGNPVVSLCVRFLPPARVPAPPSATGARRPALTPMASKPTPGGLWHMSNRVSA